MNQIHSHRKPTLISVVVGEQLVLVIRTTIFGKTIFFHMKRKIFCELYFVIVNVAQKKNLLIYSNRKEES